MGRPRGHVRRYGAGALSGSHATLATQSNPAAPRSSVVNHEVLGRRLLVVGGGGPHVDGPDRPTRHDAARSWRRSRRLHRHGAARHAGVGRPVGARRFRVPRRGRHGNAAAAALRDQGVKTIVVLLHEGGLQAGTYGECNGTSGPTVNIASALNPAALTAYLSSSGPLCPPSDPNGGI